MRSVMLTVGAKIIGEGNSWAYPKGQNLGLFAIPIYEMKVVGHDNNKKLSVTTFPVYRFGVQSEDGKTVHSVGLSENQRHIIKAWKPNYKVHSFPSVEDGAWVVTGTFYIHDGPDDHTQIEASIGCVEVWGDQGFVKFNDLLISLMDPPGKTRDEKCFAIARSGLLTIVYEKAPRPPIKPAAGSK